MKLRYLFLIFVVLFSLNFVSSKFVCGEVESIDSMTPSWYSVEVYRGFNQTSCLVSPDGYKYCCDLDSIGGYSWELGDIWFAKIVNTDVGYLAREVNLTLGSGSYDVFPKMTLEKVIQLREPDKKVYLNLEKLNYSFIFLDLVEEAKLNQEEIEILNSSYFEEINVSYGVNSLEIVASVGEDIFTLESDFGIISSYELSREFECEGCSKKKVRKNEMVEVNLILNLSEELNGFIYKEYIPSSWEILSGQEVYSSSSDYNYLSWEINSTFLNVTYSVFSPDMGDSDYFAGYLEDLFLGEEEIVLYKNVKPVSRGGRSKSSTQNYEFNPEEFTQVLPGRAITISSDSLSGAIVSKKIVENGFFEITEFGLNKNLFYRQYDFFKVYSLESNLGEASEKIILDLNLSEGEDFEIVGVNSKGKKFGLTGYFVATDTYRIETEEILKKVFVFDLKEDIGIFSGMIDFYLNQLLTFKENFSLF